MIKYFKKNTLYLMPFLVLLSGCYSGAGIYRVESKVDPYNDTHILKQIDNGIMGFMNDDNANTYYMDIYYDLKQNQFYLSVQAIRDNWLFIEKIIFLADGKKLEFPFSNKNREVIGGGTVMEWDLISMTEDEIKTLVNAQKVTCRLMGSSVYRDLNDLSKIQQNWKSFYSTELKKHRRKK